MSNVKKGEIKQIPLATKDIQDKIWGEILTSTFLNDPSEANIMRILNHDAIREVLKQAIPSNNELLDKNSITIEEILNDPVLSKEIIDSPILETIYTKSEYFSKLLVQSDNALQNLTGTKEKLLELFSKDSALRLATVSTNLLLYKLAMTHGYVVTTERKIAGEGNLHLQINSLTSVIKGENTFLPLLYANLAKTPTELIFNPHTGRTTHYEVTVRVPADGSVIKLNTIQDARQPSHAWWHSHLHYTFNNYPEVPVLENQFVSQVLFKTDNALVDSLCCVIIPVGSMEDLTIKSDLDTNIVKYYKFSEWIKDQPKLQI